MHIVNIADLRNRLSHYLKFVRRGQPVLIRSRDRIVARIEPAGETGDSAAPGQRQLQDLETRGIVRRGKRPLDRDFLARRPRIKADVVAALLAEREEGR